MSREEFQFVLAFLFGYFVLGPMLSEYVLNRR